MEVQSKVLIPRVAIKFCTQCKWNLRAAYYAQELLQTFSTTLGEVSLLPSSGGIFTITLYHQTEPQSPTSTSTSNANSTQARSQEGESQGLPAEYNISSDATSTSDSNISSNYTNPTSSSPSVKEQTQPHPQIQETLIWDRTRDQGFPETKELKNRIRNIVDPKRDMGHIDRSLKKGQTSTPATSASTTTKTTTSTLVSAEAKAKAEESRLKDEMKGDSGSGPEATASGGEGLNFGDNVPGMRNDENGGPVVPEAVPASVPVSVGAGENKHKKEEEEEVECEDCR